MIRRVAVRTERIPYSLAQDRMDRISIHTFHIDHSCNWHFKDSCTVLKLILSVQDSVQIVKYRKDDEKRDHNMTVSSGIFPTEPIKLLFLIFSILPVNDYDWWHWFGQLKLFSQIFFLLLKKSSLHFIIQIRSTIGAIFLFFSILTCNKISYYFFFYQSYNLYKCYFFKKSDIAYINPLYDTIIIDR